MGLRPDVPPLLPASMVVHFLFLCIVLQALLDILYEKPENVKEKRLEIPIMFSCFRLACGLSGPLYSL